MKQSLLLWLLAWVAIVPTSVVWSFSIIKASRHPSLTSCTTTTRTKAATRAAAGSFSCLYAASDSEGEEASDDDDDQTLILGDDALQSQMHKLRSKYPVSENAYLAAARERSKRQAESKERQATDGDWQDMARQKAEQFGTVDDWEESQKEAGNVDSQILLPDPPSEGGEGGGDGNGEDDEPKLLLF